MLATALAICGVLGPVLFWSAVVVGAALRPDYSHVRDAISELGVGPNASLMNAAFIGYGTLTFLFALGLRRALVAARGASLGPAYLAGSGVAVALLGALWLVALALRGGPPLPEPVVLRDEEPLFVRVHDLLALAAYVFGTLACFATAATVRSDPRWRGYDVYSRWSGFLAAGLIGSSLLVDARFPQALAAVGFGDGTLPAVLGLAQRVLTLDLEVWVAVIAARLLFLSRARVLAAASRIG